MVLFVYAVNLDKKEWISLLSNNVHVEGHTLDTFVHIVSKYSKADFLKQGQPPSLARGSWL